MYIQCFDGVWPEGQKNISYVGAFDEQNILTAFWEASAVFDFLQADEHWQQHDLVWRFQLCFATFGVPHHQPDKIGQLIIVDMQYPWNGGIQAGKLDGKSCRYFEGFDDAQD